MTGRPRFTLRGFTKPLPFLSHCAGDGEPVESFPWSYTVLREELIRVFARNPLDIAVGWFGTMGIVSFLGLMFADQLLDLDVRVFVVAALGVGIALAASIVGVAARVATIIEVGLVLRAAHRAELPEGPDASRQIPPLPRPPSGWGRAPHVGDAGAERPRLGFSASGGGHPVPPAAHEVQRPGERFSAAGDDDLDAPWNRRRRPHGTLWE